MARGISIIILGFACALALTANAFADELRLKDNFEINGPNITIGDIFDNAGDGANRILASAPKSGQKLVFAIDALAGRVNNMGFVWKAPKDIKQITIGGNSSKEIHSANVIAPSQNIETKEIAVLNRNVSKDETITYDMIDFIAAPQSLSKDVIIDAEILIGSRAKTALNANTPLKSFQIGAPLMVKRGQSVLLIHEIGGLKITMQAKALEDGFKGAKIKTINLQSNRIIEAIVENDGSARAIGVMNSKTANLH